MDPTDYVTSPAPNVQPILTAAMFEAAGVVVAEKPADGLTPSQSIIPALSKAEILRQAAPAMAQLVRGDTWAAWRKVLPVFDLARSAAMGEADGRPSGRRYVEAYHKWFRCHSEFEPLGKMDSGLRRRFVECFNNLAAIDTWLASLPPERRLKLNYPPTVLVHWKNSQKRQNEDQDESDEDYAEPHSAITLETILAWVAQDPSHKQQLCAALIPNFRALRDILEILPPEISDEINRRIRGLVVSRVRENRPRLRLSNVITNIDFCGHRRPEGSGTPASR
jgi:hypothetical protein